MSLQYLKYIRGGGEGRPEKQFWYKISSIFGQLLKIMASNSWHSHTIGYITPSTGLDGAVFCATRITSWSTKTSLSHFVVSYVSEMLKYFFRLFVFGWAQGLSRTGITRGRFGRPYGVLGIEPWRGASKVKCLIYLYYWLIYGGEGGERECKKARWI